MKKPFITCVLAFCLCFGFQSCDQISKVYDKTIGSISSSHSKNVGDEADSEYEETIDVEEEEEEVAKPRFKPHKHGLPSSMTLSGKIGGKYPVLMKLNIAERHGVYYYTRTGTKYPLELVWDDFDEATGLLNMHEYTDEGGVSGYFTGYLSPDGYSGSMTNYKGQEFSFNLSPD